MLSFGDTIYINFIRNIKDAELERHFFSVLQELGLSATVGATKAVLLLLCKFNIVG